MEESDQIRLRKGDEITLRMDAAAFEGGCVGRHEGGMAVFVSGCVPGDLVRVRVGKTRKRHAEARLLQVVENSPVRREPRCSHFGDCGGCRWQNMLYTEQIRWKRQHVEDAIRRIGHLADVPVLPAIGCPDEFYYRNKMEFSFGTHRWLTEREIAGGEEFSRDFALGLHVPGRYDRVLDVNECFLQSPLSNRLLNATREFSLEHRLSIYDSHTHSGLLRNLVIRHGVATDQTMVILVTLEEADEAIAAFTKLIREQFPEVTTLVQGINRKKAQIAFSEETRILYGPGTITELLCGNRFTVSPFSFFQTNTGQAQVLYDQALKAAAITPDDVVWDLYCGAGTITLAAARLAKSALGIELNQVSVADANANALLNGIGNTQFIAGDLKDVMRSEGMDQHTSPDVLITDPPRAGMHEDVVRRILELTPGRIVYVSCNPTTQARDLEILGEKYSVLHVQPVDMFPQTYHVETVASLRLRNGIQ